MIRSVNSCVCVDAICKHLFRNGVQLTPQYASVFHRAHPDSSVHLAEDASNLTVTDFNTSSSTVVIVHGFTESHSSNTVQAIRNGTLSGFVLSVSAYIRWRQNRWYLWYILNDTEQNDFLPRVVKPIPHLRSLFASIHSGCLRVQSSGSWCRIWNGRSGTREGFPQYTSLLPCQLFFPGTPQHRTGWFGRNAVKLYAEGAGIDFRSRHQISWLIFSEFSSASPGNCWVSTSIKPLSLPS
jgi:hypothetical protein